MADQSDVSDRIIQLFQRKGDATYGEHVTQTEHALQCAALAEAAGADSATVVAALLHDIGHLLDKRGEDAAERGIDTRHEVLGAQWLERYFGTAVSEPVRWHVDAKRYLCAVESGYSEELSEASKLSLGLQGGPFSVSEASDFASRPYFQQAVAVRRWDDAGKVEGLELRTVAAYREHMDTVLAGAHSAC